ncbi:hypothetical protein CVT24_009776 [Panaeolus cyanescens]|uniref:Thioredoxin domain-containing protein n=1 Tax=Panaeolus cyanescens TaxID=181874 RepID=A0A409VAD9_9AGAR|nr:hypothetical protein CVT24_009776 [Panaeolus cyanescens]
MPLYVADGSIDPITLQTVPERYIIFYSSIVDGKMWCPDCVAVDKLVKEVFSEDGPAALIVYVGERSQWKNPTNVYHQHPWNITNIPTIVKQKDGHEVARLADDRDILKKLKSFAD